MPLLTIRHLTEYTYKRPVSFDEDHIMVRPKESVDQRLIEAWLDVVRVPPPSPDHRAINSCFVGAIGKN